MELNGCKNWMTFRLHVLRKLSSQKSKHESQVQKNGIWFWTFFLKVACFFKIMLDGSCGPVSLPNMFLKTMLKINISVRKNSCQNQDTEVKYFSIWPKWQYVLLLTINHHHLHFHIESFISGSFVLWNGD